MSDHLQSRKLKVIDVEIVETPVTNRSLWGRKHGSNLRRVGMLVGNSRPNEGLPMHAFAGNFIGCRTKTSGFIYQVQSLVSCQ